MLPDDIFERYARLVDEIGGLDVDIMCEADRVLAEYNELHREILRPHNVDPTAYVQRPFPTTTYSHCSFIDREDGNLRFGAKDGEGYDSCYLRLPESYLCDPDRREKMAAAMRAQVADNAEKVRAAAAERERKDREQYEKLRARFEAEARPDGRAVCTAAAPMPPGAPGNWAHPDARSAGDTEWNDYYHCPHCGLDFSVPLPDA